MTAATAELVTEALGNARSKDDYMYSSKQVSGDEFNQNLTRLPFKQQLRWLRTRKPVAYRELTCMNLR